MWNRPGGARWGTPAVLADSRSRVIHPGLRPLTEMLSAPIVLPLRHTRRPLAWRKTCVGAELRAILYLPCRLRPVRVGDRRRGARLQTPRHLGAGLFGTGAFLWYHPGASSSSDFPDGFRRFSVLAFLEYRSCRRRGLADPVREVIRTREGPARDAPTNLRLPQHVGHTPHLPFLHSHEERQRDRASCHVPRTPGSHPACSRSPGVRPNPWREGSRFGSRGRSGR